jgi:acyl-homoserine lactone acylase PvdQ
MLRRILSVLVVALVMAAMMLSMAMPAFAFANPDSNSSGQGQSIAGANCTANITKQQAQVIHGETGTRPTNCDHFYQAAG